MKEGFEKINLTKEEKEPEKKEPEKEIETLRYFKGLEPLGDLFLGSWYYHLKVDPEAKTFYFDHKNREIGISPKLIEKLKLEREEKKFAFFHELAHLAQLFQAPDEYLRSFQIPKEKAKDNPLLEKAYHQFFNIFYDIHGNSLVIDRLPFYQKGGAEERIVPQLYEKFFQIEDFSKLPLSSQFLYSLIKGVMTKQELFQRKELNISQEVSKEIEKEFKYFGKTYNNLQDFVKENIFNPEQNYKVVFFHLNKVLLPIFEKLLKKDIESGKIREIPELPFDLDQGFSEEKIKGIIDEYKKGADRTIDMKEKLEKEAKDKLEKAGLSAEEIKRALEIVEFTKTQISQLETLWENFIQKNIEFALQKREGYKIGIAISPEELIRNLPTLLTEPSEAKIFYRHLPEISKEEFKPRRISLVFLEDFSGSMDEGKRKALQEVNYSLAKSLINFKRNSDLAFRERENPLSIDLNIIGFGSSGAMKELFEKKPREREEEQIREVGEELDFRLFKAISQILSQNLGGTDDSQALLEALKIVEKRKKRLEEDEEIMIVLEITDGETATVEASKKLVEKLNKVKNVYARAIQIPGTIYSEGPPKVDKEGRPLPPEVLLPSGTFKEVWDKFGRRLEDINILRETVVAILYDALSKKIKEGG